MIARHELTTPQRGVIFVLIIGSLYLVSQTNFLLFHSVVEIFSIVVASCIFLIAWNTRHLTDNTFLIFLGIAYLFVGSLDLLHTLSYKGLGIFATQGANLSTQMWISSRLQESISLLLATALIGRKIQIRLILTAYLVINTLLLISIFWWPIFPTCFIEGSGLTPFKKISEIIIILILAITLVNLHKKHDAFPHNVLRQLYAAILCTILAELCFTLYYSIYDHLNITGHLFKLLSFYLIYQALVESSLKQPTQTLFRELEKQRTTLARSERQFQQLANSIDEVFWTHSIQSDTLLYVSPAFTTIWGHDPQEVYQDSGLYLATIHPEDRGKVLLSRKAQQLQQAGALEYRIIRPDGSIRWISDKYFPVHQEDGTTLTTGLAADITKRKLAEIELHQLNQELTEFNYVVAHDLKAPLRAMGNYCHFLKEDLAGMVSEEQQLYLDQLLSASQEASQLVHDLLLYARIKRDNIEAVPIDPGLLFQRIISSFSDRDDLKITLPDQWPRLSSDPLLLQQIFHNLIENGITFNKSSPKEIDITWEITGPKQVTFLIRDNGIGIPEQFHQKIFNLFERLTPDRRFKGTGIGLAIVKKAVTNLGGIIQVRSVPGMGTTFLVSLANPVPTGPRSPP